MHIVLKATIGKKPPCHTYTTPLLIFYVHVVLTRVPSTARIIYVHRHACTQSSNTVVCAIVYSVCEGHTMKHSMTDEIPKYRNDKKQGTKCEGVPEPCLVDGQ